MKGKSSNSRDVRYGADSTNGDNSDKAGENFNMLIKNRDGLSESGLKKVLKPFAHNTERMHDPRDIGRRASKILEDDPELLVETGKLLEESQSD